MSNEIRRNKTENGNKYIRYYPPEGENTAFKELNGAFRRGIEEEASIRSAATIMDNYGYEKFKEWIFDPNNQPDIEKQAKIEFIKTCESLACLSAEDLQFYADKASERLLNNSIATSRESSQGIEILERSRNYGR